MKTLPIAALLALLAACGSTAPVRRAPDYGPQQPVPTLVAAAVYDYGPPTPEIEIQDVRASFEAAKANLEEDPTLLLDAARELTDSAAAAEHLRELAPALQTKFEALLAEQGFLAEYDGERTAAMMANVPREGHALVIPETADTSFTQTPLFGPGSKGSIASRLGTDRPREAFASMQAWFDPKGEDGDERVTCFVRVQILDRDADLVFDGSALGSSGEMPGLHQRERMELAFDAALEQLRRPLVEEL